MTIKAIITDLSSDLYDIYFNDYIENFDIILYSGFNNRDLQNYNDDLIKNIIDSLIYYDDYKNDFENMDQFFKYYHLEKNNNKNWNNREKNTYKKVCESFNNPEYTSHFLNYDDLIKIINIIKCKKYNYIDIRGFSQGEKTTLFYNPDEISENDIKLIESLYFGGCNEVIFTDENIRKINKIYSCDYQSFIIPSIYDIDDIKKEISNFYTKETKLNISIYEAIEKQVIKTEYKKIQ